MAICQTTRQAIARDPDTGAWHEVDPGNVSRAHTCRPVMTTVVEVLAPNAQGLTPGRCAYCSGPATLRVGGNDDACDRHVVHVVYDVTRVQVTT